MGTTGVGYTVRSSGYLSDLFGGPLNSTKIGRERGIKHEFYITFRIQSVDRRSVIAIGCDEGVWVGFQDDPKSMHQVVYLKKVTECATLSEHGLFLVLADKALYAYRTEMLLPVSSENRYSASKGPGKISGDKSILLFRVGKLDGRTLVITAQKKGLDTIFRVLEPEVERDRKPSSTIGFKKNKEFFIPSPTYDIVFLKAKLAVLTTNGFEILDLNELKSVQIPPRNEGFLKRLFSPTLTRPIGMFATHVGAKFILCYDTYGLYVDRRGDPFPDVDKIWWEATADRVALLYPYLLLFSSGLIEIRDILSGKLVQKIPGNNMRCIWDGREVGVTSRTLQAHAVIIVPDGNETRYEIIEVAPIV